MRGSPGLSRQVVARALSKRVHVTRGPNYVHAKPSSEGEVKGSESIGECAGAG